MLKVKTLEKSKQPRGFEAAKMIREGVSAMRLTPPERPLTKDGEIIEPRIPHDLTILNEQQLFRLYSEFCALQAYCQGQLGWIEAEKLVRKRAARMTRSVAKVRKKGSVPVSMLEAVLDVDEETEAKENALLVQDGIAIITDAMLKAYTVGADACSRELSRRLGGRELHHTQR